MFDLPHQNGSPDQARIILRTGDSAQETYKFAILRCKLSVSYTPFREKTSTFDICENLYSGTDSLRPVDDHAPERRAPTTTPQSRSKGEICHVEIPGSAPFGADCCAESVLLGILASDGGSQSPDRGPVSVPAAGGPDTADFGSRVGTAVAWHLSAGRLMAAVRVLDGVA